MVTPPLMCYGRLYACCADHLQTDNPHKVKDTLMEFITTNTVHTNYRMSSHIGR